jgi:hypothetical protein
VEAATTVDDLTRRFGDIFSVLGQLPDGFVLMRCERLVRSSPR